MALHLRMRSHITHTFITNGEMLYQSGCKTQKVLRISYMYVTVTLTILKTPLI